MTTRVQSLFLLKSNLFKLSAGNLLIQVKLSIEANLVPALSETQNYMI